MAVIIDIVTEFKGKKNISDATRSIGTMETAIGKLGKQFAAVFAVDKIVAFGRASVDAFAADQKSAVLLANTLKNVGQQFQDLSLEKFVTSTSLATGVMKNDLRAGLSTLVRYTRNATDAQDLLNLSLDISKGTGKDLSAVTLAVGKAYQGTTTNLARLGIGISAANLKGKTWAETQKMLNQLFKGDASVAADTYSGKIDRLKASYEEAKVTIGTGIVDAFSKLSQSGSLDTFVNAMQSAATYIANIITGLGVIGGKIVSVGEAINKHFPLASVLKFLEKTSLIGAVAQLGKSATQQKTESVGPHGAPGAMKALQDAAKAKADDAAAIKKQNDAKAAQLKLDKAALALKQASKTLDMQQIEIAAALQNKNLSEKDKAALKLQQAILDDNASAATSLAAQIAALTDSEKNLAQALSVPLPTNPFDSIVQGATAAQTAVESLKSSMQVNSISGQRPFDWRDSGYAPTTSTGTAPMPSTGTPSLSGGVSQSGPIIYVTPSFQFTIDGSVVTDAVTLQQIQNTAAGVAGSYNRSQTFAY